MIKFENNELEIAIVTYNRALFIEEWINKSYNELIKRNISLSIYDSSTNNDTQLLVDKLINDGKLIKYTKVDSETPIGYKPMLPLMSSEAKYVWVSGDSRYHDFNELDNKVFNFIKQDVDYILIEPGNYNRNNDGKIYTDQNELLKDGFIGMTCIGLSIYKRSIFNSLLSNKTWLETCNERYKDNYGFGWIGYFLEAYDEGDYKSAYTYVKTYPIFAKKKKQAWATRFYECWVENLCYLMDYVSDRYTTAYNVPRETWDKMKLAGIHYSYVARKSGGLNLDIYNKYLSDGTLPRCTDKLKKIRFFATANMAIIEIIYFVFRCLRKIKHIIFGNK